MKKVLIVFPFAHHESLISGQCDLMNRHGIQADALLVLHSRITFFNYSKLRLSSKFSFLYSIYENFRNTSLYYRLKIDSYLRESLLKSCFSYYDIIEFAGVYNEKLLEYAKFVHSREKDVIVRLWGSDFYRIYNPHQDWHNELFDLASRIFVASKKMSKDFILAFPLQQDKLEVQSYGLSQLELLKDILDGKIAKDTSFLDERAYNRIVISIGYNGRTWQQHFYILDAIANLPHHLRNNLFLILPMTYSNSNEYIDYMRSRLNQLAIPFQILVERLSLVQNLSLRIISDITVCIQFTDALSASVQESMMAGSVFIAGEWLPYKVFFEHGMYYHPTSLANLSDTLNLVISNLEEEKQNCLVNKEIMYLFSSWKKKDSYLDYYNKS